MGVSQFAVCHIPRGRRRGDGNVHRPDCQHLHGSTRRDSAFVFYVIAARAHVCDNKNFGYPENADSPTSFEEGALGKESDKKLGTNALW